MDFCFQCSVESWAGRFTKRCVASLGQGVHAFFGVIFSWHCVKNYRRTLKVRGFHCIGGGSALPPMSCRTLGWAMCHRCSPSTSTLSSTCSCRLGHSPGNSSGCFDKSSVPAGFLQQTCTDNTVPRSQQNRVGMQDTEHNTRTLQNNRQISQKRVHYRTIQADTNVTPMQRLI